MSVLPVSSDTLPFCVIAVTHRYAANAVTLQCIYRIESSLQLHVILRYGLLSFVSVSVKTQVIGS